MKEELITEELGWYFPSEIYILPLGTVRGLRGEFETIQYTNNTESIEIKDMYIQLMELAGFQKMN